MIFLEGFSLDEKKIDLAKDSVSDDAKKEIKIEDIDPASQVQQAMASDGADSQSQQAVHNAPEQVSGGQVTESAPTPEEISNRNKTIGIAGIAGAVLLLALIVGAGIKNNSYEKPVEYYYEAQEDGSGKKFEKAIGKDIVKSIDKQFKDGKVYKESDEIDNVHDFFDLVVEEQHDELVDEYGKNIKIKYDIIDKDKLSKKELESLSKQIKSSFDIDKKIKKGYELKVETTIKGKDDKDTETEKFMVIKMGGDWSVYSEELGLMPVMILQYM